MREIFSYNLKYKAQEKVVTVQEDGSELSKMEPVEKTVRVIIKEPTRKDTEAAQNVYQEAWSDAVRRGILTRAIIDKTYSNSKGFLSEEDKKDLQAATDKIVEIQGKYKDLKDVKEEDRTDEQKEIVKNLAQEFSDASKKFDDLEQDLENLYRNSAETIAFEKQLMYNTVFLSYIEKDGKVQPIVAGESLEEKLTRFDSILDDQSNDDAKEKAKLYDEILKRNGKYLLSLSTGKILISQLKEINEKVDSGDIVL